MEGPLKDLGPCAVIYNSQDLGPTFGGVVFKHSVESRMIKEDQQGTYEVDGIVVGGSCEVTVPLTRTTLAKLGTVIPGADVSDDELIARSASGQSMLDNAHELILKPIEDGVATSDQTKWLTLPKAYPVPDLELPFDNEGQRVYRVVFKALLDTDNNVLFKMGSNA